MSCTISDTLTALGSDGVVRALRRLSVVASPSAVPLFVRQGAGQPWYEVQGNRVETTSDGNGSWTLVLPYQSDCDPSTVTWSITLPDGTVWRGTVPAGVAGPVTMQQLKTSYGWVSG